MHYVYLLVSKRNRKIYTGYTKKTPTARLKEHNAGTNKFTRLNRPWSLIYYESFSCKRCAKEREKFLKSGVGKKLKKIIVNGLLTESGAVG